MWENIKQIYRSSWSFALALPLLFVVPALPEILQHVAEYHLGMYDSLSGAHAAANSGLRLGFGYAKTLALLLPGYWFVRYMAWNGDAARAARLEAPAFPLWLVLFAIGGVLQGLSLFGPPVGSVIGLTGNAATVANVFWAIVVNVISIYFTAWAVAWPLGNASCGPLQSVTVMHGSFWRAVGYMVAGVIPLMAVHYALGLGAIGRSPWLAWPMLAADVVVVAFLALTMTGSMVVAARDAARRKGYSLFSGAAGERTV